MGPRWSGKRNGELGGCRVIVPVQKMTASVRTIRIALETNQKHSLRLLDLEMDKLKKLLPQEPS